MANNDKDRDPPPPYSVTMSKNSATFPRSRVTPSMSPATTPSEGQPYGTLLGPLREQIYILERVLQEATNAASAVRNENAEAGRARKPYDEEVEAVRKCLATTMPLVVRYNEAANKHLRSIRATVEKESLNGSHPSPQSSSSSPNGSSDGMSLRQLQSHTLLVPVHTTQSHSKAYLASRVRRQLHEMLMRASSASSAWKDLTGHVTRRSSLLR